MLLCVAGMLFSPKRTFMEFFSSCAGYSIIVYGDYYASLDEAKDPKICRCSTRDEIDQLVMRNWGDNFLLLIRSYEDWAFFDRRPGRMLVYIDMPAVFRWQHASSLTRSELERVIRCEFSGPICQDVLDAFDEIKSERPESCWMLLDDLFDRQSHRGIADLRRWAASPTPGSEDASESRSLKCHRGGYRYSDLMSCAGRVLFATRPEEMAKFLEGFSGFEKALTPRPTWEQYFIDIARAVSERSNCVKKSGCVVVNGERRILATGYSGTPSGIENCYLGGCKRCLADGIEYYSREFCFCIHSIQNALLYLGKRDTETKLEVYCLAYPCIGCSKAMIQFGVKRVIYQNIARNKDLTLPHDVLLHSGMEVLELETPKSYIWCNHSQT